MDSKPTIRKENGELVLDIGLVYYISGPMAGYPELNFPAFTRAAGILRDSGLTVLPAHEVKHPNYVELFPELNGDVWVKYLEEDLIQMISQTQGIIMLKGWPESPGACFELDVSLRLKRPVFYYNEADYTLMRMSKNGLVA